MEEVWRGDSKHHTKLISNISGGKSLILFRNIWIHSYINQCKKPYSTLIKLCVGKRFQVWGRLCHLILQCHLTLTAAVNFGCHVRALISSYLHTCFVYPVQNLFSLVQDDFFLHHRVRTTATFLLFLGDFHFVNNI